MTRWEGATWCDVTRNGLVVAVVGDEVRVWPELPLAVLPEPLGWLRAEVNAGGALAVVGQGQSGQGWLWVGERSWRALGETYGVSPLEIIADGTGWLVVMQTAEAMYDLRVLDAAGHNVSVVPCAMAATATGFLDWTDTRLLFTDAGRRVGGVMLPNRAGGYLVGQDPQTDRLLLADEKGVPLRVLSDGPPVREPRGAWVNGEMVAASRSDDGGAVVVRGRVQDFPLWTPVVVPPPIPDPEPTPEPEDPVSTPQHIIDLLVSIADAVDARYPGLRATNLSKWMGIVAWRAHQADRRIGRKRGSTTRPISHDTLGYLLHEAGVGRFSAVSICRDNPGQNERRYPPLDYKLVGPEQVWSVPDLVIEETPGPTPPPVEPPPPTSDLEARVAALERWRVELGAYVVRTATGWPR